MSGNAILNTRKCYLSTHNCQNKSKLAYIHILTYNMHINMLQLNESFGRHRCHKKT